MDPIIPVVASLRHGYGHTERIGEELDAVVGQLAAAAGPGGRGRKLGSG
jgi:hypothetical protein